MVTCGQQDKRKEKRALTEILFPIFTPEMGKRMDLCIAVSERVWPQGADNALAALCARVLPLYPPKWSSAVGGTLSQKIVQFFLIEL